jgi:acetyltransferase-like isoleucine patch superfamily enzyme
MVMTTGITWRAVRSLERPRGLWWHLNAQLRLRGKARVPLSVGLRGRVVVERAGEIRLGERIFIRATVAPVELIAKPGGRLAIGDGTFINYGASLTAYESVTVGRDCHIGHYAFICDNDEHDILNKHALPQSCPVVIEDGAWLGTRVTVLKGVRIGRDSVIGAGSVVTHDIPPRCVAAGIPARVLRQF